MSVRVRFAPSPTGALHIGGLRTALYNYLFAKNNGGQFVLRIEDTDQPRSVKNAEKYITEALKWSGLRPDEGPSTPGKFGPYRQSQRKAIYQKYIGELIDQGKAYYAFDTPEELSKIRATKENLQVWCPQPYAVQERTQSIEKNHSEFTEKFFLCGKA